MASFLLFVIYCLALSLSGLTAQAATANADAHSNLTIPYAPPPEISVWTGAHTASRIDLPIRTGSG